MQKDTKKILIIEDEELLRELYSAKFKFKGYDVAVAKNGAEGIVVAKTFHPDVILLDIAMPHFDGWDALAFIKSNAATAYAVTIVFSNLPQEGNQKKALEMGAAAFLVKTRYTPSELVNEVGKLLNK